MTLVPCHKGLASTEKHYRIALLYTRVTVCELGFFQVILENLHFYGQMFKNETDSLALIVSVVPVKYIIAYTIIFTAVHALENVMSIYIHLFAVIIRTQTEQEWGTIIKEAA